MPLSAIHLGLARACALFSLLIGLYGLWLFYRKQKVDGNFFGVMAVGELLYLAQGLVGALIYLGGRRPENFRSVHILYGIVLVITLPGAYAYLRGGDERRETLIYGFIGLFLAGVSLRATFTGAR